MRIKNISCKQFAGVRNRNVPLTDGLNIIYGKNESGKSTLVNLLSRTLFQKAALDGRRDKDFKALYFPGSRKGNSRKADFADGEVTFETEKGSYTLSKEWGKDARCELSTPDYSIRDQSEIDAALKELLVYGEGVYSDMLFSSQRNTDTSLQTILDASKKTDAKREIVDAVSKAFVESDGISIDAIEQAIADRIEEIAGKHWDFEREVPVRKSGSGRWDKQRGKILEAYYELDEAKKALVEISELTDDADRTAKEYEERVITENEAKKAFDDFNKYASLLQNQSERKSKIKRDKQDLKELKRILSDWPNLVEELDKAETLRNEACNRKLLDQYEEAKKFNDEIASMEKKIVNRLCPEDTDIKQAKKAQKRIADLENKLCGMNLNAAIKMLNDDRIEIISLRTGEPVELSDGTASIAEAVTITIPGVMEMRLSPANVDVAATESQIKKQKKIVADIFTKYEVNSLDDLESLQKEINDVMARIENTSNRLNDVLDGKTFDELESVVSTAANPARLKEDIENDVMEVCGSDDIEKFITKKETIIGEYSKKYDSIELLNNKASELEETLKKEKESLSSVEDVPEEYLHISDPSAYLEDLQRIWEEEQGRRREADRDKSVAATKLESYQENYQEKNSGTPAEKMEQAERDFEKQKSLLSHWRHIEEVFKEQKENVNNNPMQDIADSFTHYLSVITGGGILAEFSEADKLDMEIYSKDRLLDYEKLSEGTKETVSLAFRLAVFDHLFPEGGGVIVFDDPFTDMDAERTAQSCELIKECANHHQVIFLTCKEEYLEKFNGNVVRI